MEERTVFKLDNAALAKICQKAYDLSVPQGLGMMHFKPGPLSDDLAETMVLGEEDPQWAIRLDYVEGRAVKLYVRRDGAEVFFDTSWFDHTTEQLATLLKLAGDLEN